ncbi:Pumilio y domain member 6 [Coemansia sp. RSA 2050]|nr:Pumilio y domain member 6 [Coemansia sp. RSA 2050]
MGPVKAKDSKRSSSDKRAKVATKPYGKNSAISAKSGKNPAASAKSGKSPAASAKGGRNSVTSAKSGGSPAASAKGGRGPATLSNPAKGKRSADAGGGGDLKAEARRLWEQLRRGDMDAEARRGLMASMMGLLGGRIREAALKHDLSRVVQTCIKHGSGEQRLAIAGELRGAEVELARSTYGRHILLRLLKHSPAARAPIMAALGGHVRRLVRHKEAAVVVDECYGVYANAAQRWALAAEFYGGDAVMGDGSGGGGGGGVTSVDALLAARPQRRAGVVAALRQAAAGLLERGAVQHGVVHRVLLDLVRLADGAERRAVIEALHGLAVEMVHTRDGAHCAMLCLLHGTARDRKALVRSFRPFAAKMARDEHAHGVLIGALDCVDDTVFAAKALLADLCAAAPALLPDAYGRRVLLYALAGRSPHYVGADALAVLRAGDAVRAATSRKDAATRRAELAAAVAPALAAWAAQAAPAAVFEPLPSQAVAETLVRAPCDKRAAWAAVVALVSRDVGPGHVLLHPVANRVVATCILAGHAPARAAAADAAPPYAGNPPYAADVLDALAASGQLVAAAKAGAFPVRALLEVPATAERARRLLRPHLAELEASSSSSGGSSGSGSNATAGAIVALLK